MAVGFYRCAPGFLVKLIVVSDLPATRDTLLLRVLGAGPVLKAALDEIAALPEDAPERGVVLPIVLRLWRQRDDTAPSDEDFFMSSQAIVDQWKRELLEKGRGEGIREGAREGVRNVLLRLLHARFGTLGAGVEGRVAAATAEELDRWVERFAVAQRIDDVFEE